MRHWLVIPLLPEILLAVLILIVPALLPALAYASPPDPAWIPGIYDDADDDDVIALVTSETPNVPAEPPLDARSTPSSVESLPPLIEKAAASPSPFASHPRAPPAS